MQDSITGVTILDREPEREMQFIRATVKKIPVPKKELTGAQKKEINQDIYMNCMYLKKNLIR